MAQFPVLGGRWIYDDALNAIFRDTAVAGDLKVPANYNTAVEVYSAFQNRFDESDLMRKKSPLRAPTNLDVILQNGAFMDDVSSRYITGGSFASDTSWTRVTTTTIGIVTFNYTVGAGTDLVAGDIGLPVTNIDGDDGTLLYFETDGTNGKAWVRPATTAAGDDWDGTTNFSVTGGTGAGLAQDAAATTGRNLWSNAKVISTVARSSEIYLFQDRGPGSAKVLPQFWPEASQNPLAQINILVKVQESGVFFDNGDVEFFARRPGGIFFDFRISLAAGGSTSVPLTTSDNANFFTGHFQVGFDAFANTTDSITVGDRLLVGGANYAIVTGINNPTGPTGTLEFFAIGVVDATGEKPAFLDNDAVTSQSAVGAAKDYTFNIDFVTQTLATFGPKALGSPPTISFGNTTASLGTGAPVAPYSITIAANTNTNSDIAEWAQMITGRAENEAGSVIYDATLAQAGSEIIDGERYVGITLRLDFSSEAGGTFTEGDLVYDQTTGARGTIVARQTGSGVYMTLRNVVGTFQTGVANLGDAPTGPTVTATIDTVTNVAPFTNTPLLNIAGGVLFGAPGVLITGLASNFSLIDDNGATQVPPQNVTLTVTNTVADDNVIAFFDDGVGEIDISRHLLAAGNNIGDTQVDVQVSIPFVTPAFSGISLIDTNGDVQRYRYASFATTVFTLAPFPDATLTAGTTQNVDDDTVFATGSTFTNAERGDLVHIAAKTASAIILDIVSATEILTTPFLNTGTGARVAPASADVMTVNKLDRSYTAGDDAFDHILDQIALGTSVVSATMIYPGSDILGLVEVRRSVPYSNPIIPFASPVTIGANSASIATIRQEDPVAA